MKVIKKLADLLNSHDSPVLGLQSVCHESIF